MCIKFFLQKRPIGPHPVPALAGAGSNARPTRGALWAVVLWRHRV